MKTSPQMCAQPGDAAKMSETRETPSCTNAYRQPWGCDEHHAEAHNAWNSEQRVKQCENHGGTMLPENRSRQHIRPTRSCPCLLFSRHPPANHSRLRVIETIRLTTTGSIMALVYNRKAQRPPKPALAIADAIPTIGQIRRVQHAI
jgi:hypothetical protein